MQENLSARQAAATGEGRTPLQDTHSSIHPQGWALSREVLIPGKDLNGEGQKRHFPPVRDPGSPLSLAALSPPYSHPWGDCISMGLCMITSQPRGMKAVCLDMVYPFQPLMIIRD